LAIFKETEFFCHCDPLLDSHRSLEEYILLLFELVENLL